MGDLYFSTLGRAETGINGGFPEISLLRVTGLGSGSVLLVQYLFQYECFFTELPPESEFFPDDDPEYIPLPPEFRDTRWDLSVFSIEADLVYQEWYPLKRAPERIQVVLSMTLFTGH